MPQRFRFQRQSRLVRARDFRAVFDTKVRRSSGPLLVYGKPNALGHSRLGMAVSRRVGGAVVRARIRRMLREAFRLLQHELPAGYDLVATVRAHAPLRLEDYERALTATTHALHSAWNRKAERS